MRKWEDIFIANENLHSYQAKNTLTISGQVFYKKYLFRRQVLVIIFIGECNNLVGVEKG